jgi:DNA repair exonuclease SbcCD ATPase subunit
MPSRVELEKYRRQLARIEQAAEVGKIPVPGIQAALNHFLERMGEVVGSMERESSLSKAGKKDHKRPNDRARVQPAIVNSHIEWIINQPQVDRILEHLRLLNDYIESRNSLRDPINRFRLLVNKFLAQTKKELHVAASGQLSVTVAGYSQPRSINALSSGEKQLLVMLAHLSLNPNLVGSGIFIVDEPELSLHMDWQEKFVDAVREANPNVQLILATHSPAIILDREDACRMLNEVAYA